MVGSVKSWRKREIESSQVLWKKLAEANSTVERELLLLKQLANEQGGPYKNVIQNCSNLSADKWMDNKDYGAFENEIIKGLVGARRAILEARSLLKQIGDAAGVPIEPESQTQLLDETMNMQGVLLAGVPGAGGFDAVFAITLDTAPRDRLAGIWSSKGVLPLLVREDPSGIKLEGGDPRYEITSEIGSMKLE